MSSIGMAIYEFSNKPDLRPEWIRLERIDYCEQPALSRKNNSLRGLVDFFKKLF